MVGVRMQFLESPQGGDRGWRLLSGNNRPLAIGRSGTRSPAEELAALQRLAGDTEPRLRRGADGLWRWELDTDDGPEVRCPGGFARKIDARRAFQRFSQAIYEARITSAQLSSNGHREQNL
jgi:hypothetical protein